VVFVNFTMSERGHRVYYFLHYFTKYGKTIMYLFFVVYLVVLTSTKDKTIAYTVHLFYCGVIYVVKATNLISMSCKHNSIKYKYLIVMWYLYCICRIANRDITRFNHNNDKTNKGIIVFHRGLYSFYQSSQCDLQNLF